MPAAAVTIASGATWEEVAADRQAYRDASIASIEPLIPDIPDRPSNTIPLAKKVLTAEEIEITESTVEQLVPKLANGSLSSVDVANAFLRRAGLAQKAVCSPEAPSKQALTVYRRTASQNSFQSEPSNAPHIWMST
jgi:amidase